MRFCPYAQRTRMLLEHKGIQYEAINIDLKNKPDWFLARNPLGLVPVIEHDGKVVFESLICNDYLEEKFPGKRSTANDPYQRALDRMLIERQPKMIKKFYRFALKPEEDVQSEFEEQLDIFEGELHKRGAFFNGQDVGNLDFLLWPWFERLCILEVIRGFKLNNTRHWRLIEWVSRMNKVPAVQKTGFDAQSHLAFFISLRNRNPNYDYGLPAVSKL